MDVSNRLAGETSPYLLQHADNPVHWYPWGNEALARARAENKPILLSVGYSACHWCHVMAHESFEDPRVAALMNEHFVNIKVDREERPDIDQIYQTAHALLTRRSGGWPLTMFLTPQQEPFFGGTYFPNESRHGLISFSELLPRVAAAYHQQGEAIAEQSARLREALFAREPVPGAEPTAGAADALFSLIQQSFDPEHGGFGHAPKFPHQTDLEFCLRRFGTNGAQRALHLATLSLRHMAEGGIFDQLAGGFCRYSVDREWSIPHFEKMLYDNGPLLGLYADAWRLSQEPLFERAVISTIDWLRNEMRSPEGAFCSSLDADSEGEEGKFYVWTKAEARSLLGKVEYAVAAPHWGLDQPPNFENHYWNLRVMRDLDEIARELAIEPGVAEQHLNSARQKLLAARERRVRPGRDDKILTSWNALVVRGLSRAGRVFAQREWIVLAQQAADQVRTTLWKKGRFLATSKDGRAHLNAYLDDYAFWLAALLEMMQTEFRAADLQWAIEIADALLAHFEDPDHGGFFFTSDDHEALLLRSKPGLDNPTPSGNGVASESLILLGHLVGNVRYLNAAERAFRVFSPQISSAPSGLTSLVMALEGSLKPPTLVHLVGDVEQCREWQTQLEESYRPSTFVFLVGEETPPLAVAPHTRTAEAKATALVCRGTECLPPIHKLAEIERAISVNV